MPTTFAAQINGDDIYAKRAECDAAGNTLSTTYATKSEVPTATSDLTNDSGFITAEDVPSNQVPSDWNEADPSSVQYILNKPTIPSGAQLVPAATSADADKVLTVDAQGTPAWETPSGGGTTYAAGKGIDISNDTVSVITGSGLSIGSNTVGSSSPALGYSSVIKGITAKTRWSYYSSSPVQLHVVLGNIYDATKYAVAKTPYACRLVSGDYVLDVGDVIPFSYDIADYDTYGGFDSVSACNIYVTRVGSTEGYAPNGEQYIYASEYLLSILYNLDVYVENPLPSSTSGDSGKVLTVNSSGSPAWSTPAPGGVTDVEVDGASVVSGGVASITMPTVDQTYNSASTNAQSGVAVAGALATKENTISDLSTIRSGAALGATSVQPGDLAPYATTSAMETALAGKQNVLTAGDGIAIDANNEISVAVDNSTITVNASGKIQANIPAPVQENFIAVYGSTTFSEIYTAYNNGKAVFLKYPETVSFAGTAGRLIPVSEIFVSSPPADSYAYFIGKSRGATNGNYNRCLWTTYRVTGTNVWDSIVNSALPYVDTAGKVLTSTANGGVQFSDPVLPTVDQTFDASSSNAQSGVAIAGELADIEQVPAVTSSDDGKVLKASYSGGAGTYAWDTETDTTYSAGNMISIDPNSNNAIGVLTTAGITDVQQVNSLPAQTVPTVLYLIPET